MSREPRLAHVFVELTDTLVDDFDVIDLLHTLCERSVELLQADAAGLILADQRGRLELVASTSQPAEELELFVLQNDEGPCLDCYRTGEQVVNINLAEVRDRWPAFHAATTKIGYRSTHALPLRLRGQVIGALNLLCRNNLELSDNDIAIGQALCDVATVGVLQQRTIRQAEVLAEQLQAALNSRILIEQAKGVLAERAGIDVEAAFMLMRTYARSNRQQLTVVATEVIDDTIAAGALQATSGTTGA